MSVAWPVHPWIDTTRAPLLMVRFPATATDQEVVDFSNVLLAFWPTVAQPIGWVVDASATKDAPASQRKIFADYEKKYLPYTKRFHIGMAMVVRGMVVRHLLTAIYWMSPPPYEYTVVESLEQAWRWVEARMQAAMATSLPTPPPPKP